MLLKGIRETELHADPLMAAEMVLIRLAHAADLPGGEELAKLVKQAAPPGERAPPKTAREPMRGGAAPTEARAALAVKPETPNAPVRIETRPLSSFQDILTLLTEKRLIKLKADIERFVRPIRVSPGQFELALEPDAHPGLPGEIARNLEAQTGMRWMVMVAKDGGDPPVSRQKRETRDSLFIAARQHPDVQAVLTRFPGAEIVDVRQPEQIVPQPMSDSDEESR